MALFICAACIGARSNYLRAMSRIAPGIIAPCLPTPVKKVPLGPKWVYEVKHDGYRMMARLKEGRVKLISKNGADFMPTVRPRTSARTMVAATSWRSSMLVPSSKPHLSPFQPRKISNCASGKGFRPPIINSRYRRIILSVITKTFARSSSVI